MSSARPILRIQRLRESAFMPAYKSDAAAGLDLSFGPAVGQPVDIHPGEIFMAETGLAIALPEGTEGQVRPRSGLASRHGLTLVNSPGTIDADYRGEVKIPLINLGREPVTIEPGMRIAQLVVAPVVRVAIAEAERLDDTARGSAGFGSTGVHG